MPQEVELVLCELPTSYGLTVPGREFTYYGPGEAELPRALAEALGATIKGPVNVSRTNPNGQREQRQLAGAVSADSSPLPADFPARTLLYDALFTTVESVKGASDQELLALKGLGKATLRDIRAALQ